MKRLLYAMMVAVVLSACTGTKTPKREPQLSDTLYTAAAAMKIYAYNPERALLIIDSAEIVGNLTANHASMLRAKVFTMAFEAERLDSAQRICLNLLNSDYVKEASNHETVLDLMVAISRRKYDNEQWLQWATKKADFCRKQGNEVEALRTEAEIGIVLTHLGRQEEGLQKLDDVIEQLDGVRKFNETDACIIALRRKVDVLNELGRYKEIIPIAQKIIEKTNDYEKNPNDFHDGTFREPDLADVPNYCEFYRVKAYAYLADAYANTNDILNARYYLGLFEQSRYGQTTDGRRMIAPTWCKLGEYDKMLAIYDELEENMGADTVNLIFTNMLYDRSVAAEARGDYAAAYNYMCRYAAMRQMLNDELQQSEAHEYAARYREQEQQLEIERHAIQNRMMNYILLTMLVAFLFIIILYNHTVFQKQKLSARNAVLVRLIDEQSHVERISEACKLIREKPEMSIPEVAKAVGLTPRNLDKIFRDQYGMSLTEYKALHHKANKTT